jgi:cell division protein FtsL
MRKKLTLKTEIEKTIKLLIGTLAVIIVALSVIFLFTISRSAELGYKLEQARIQNEHLKNIHEELKTKVTDAGTSSIIEDNKKIKEMKKTESEGTKYLLPEDNN